MNAAILVRARAARRARPTAHHPDAARVIEIQPGLYRLHNLYIAVEPSGQLRAVAVLAAGIDGRGWQTARSELIDFACQVADPRVLASSSCSTAPSAASSSAAASRSAPAARIRKWTKVSNRPIAP